MITKKLFPVFIFLFVSVLFFSCKKEEASLAELNFQVEEIDGVYYCSWTATNISTFENYYIVHAPFEMRVDDEPSGDFSKRWTRIDSQAIHSQNITIESEEDLTLYFQLFVEIEGRMIRSNVVVFEKGVSEVIDVFANSSILFQEANALYFFQNSTPNFVHYDFVEKKIYEKLTLPFEVDRHLYSVGNNGFGDELYLLDGNRLFILDANTLEVKTNYGATGSIKSVATNDEGLLIITVRQNPNKIEIIDRNSLVVLNDLTSSNTLFSSRQVVFLSKENNEFVEVGREYFKYFKVTDEGVVLEEEEIDTPFPNGNNDEYRIVSSPFENYFVSNIRGYVFDSSLNKIVEIASFFEDTYSSYFFDKDETFLYAFLETTIEGNSFVDKISIPDFDFVERKEYVGHTLNWFYRNDALYGAYFSDYFDCVFIKPVN